MSKVYKISTIIFVLFILCAPSCEDEQEAANREEAILAETKNDIRKEFETDYLTESALFAYETTAKQKLSDLSDYLRIMMDTSLDLSFRVKAGEMIKSTFQTENDNLDLIELDEDPVKEYRVSRIIKMGLKGELLNVDFTFDSLKIFEPLNRIDNDTYSGVLRFSQNFNHPAIPNRINKSIERNAVFFVVKKDKVFGKDSLKIWNVQLGDIR